MAVLLRIVTAVLLTVLLATASVAADGHGAEHVTQSSNGVVSAVDRGCDHCGLHETLSCAQLCIGSLQPMSEPLTASVRVSRVSLSPLVARLPKGQIPDPLPTPPIS